MAAFIWEVVIFWKKSAQLVQNTKICLQVQNLAKSAKAGFFELWSSIHQWWFIIAIDLYSIELTSSAALLLYSWEIQIHEHIIYLVNKIVSEIILQVLIKCNALHGLIRVCSEKFQKNLIYKFLYYTETRINYNCVYYEGEWREKTTTAIPAACIDRDVVLSH